MRYISNTQCKYVLSKHIVYYIIEILEILKNNKYKQKSKQTK